MAKWELIKKVIPWALLLVMVLYLITGLGITEFKTVETLTFGLLSKNLSFRIHDNLLIPFLILLFIHICLPYILRKKITNRG
jgi:cytochrome b subunit of formate dehydrogenase